jgi:hypothetical protein
MLVLAHPLCSRVIFGEKFGAVTKIINDLRQAQRIFLNVFQKLCIKCRGKRPYYPHLDCVLLEGAKK